MKRDAVQAKYFDALERRYSPDQPRDDAGRWTSGGGGESTDNASNYTAFGSSSDIVAQDRPEAGDRAALGLPLKLEEEELKGS